LGFETNHLATLVAEQIELRLFGFGFGFGFCSSRNLISHQG
jgi:hypothetical protein